MTSPKPVDTFFPMPTLIRNDTYDLFQLPTHPPTGLDAFELHYTSALYSVDRKAEFSYDLNPPLNLTAPQL